MPNTTLFARVLDPANRADPYPLYARLRETPILRGEDGTYIVSTYAEIRSLLQDSRVSSEDLPVFKRARTGNPILDFIINPIKDRIVEAHRPLLFRDPPDHGVLRRLIMTQFTTERVRATSGRVNAIVEDLIGKMRGREEIDLVGDFAYPLPVAIICELLGIPSGDEQKFQSWSATLAGVFDPDQWVREEHRLKSIENYDAITNYLSTIIKAKRKRPAADFLSGLAAYKDKKIGRMGKYDLIPTSVLLLIAGHETTVNLIANGMLTLLRHREWLERLCQDPALVPRIVEELLRFEPPVHFRTRKTPAEIPIAGTVIPKGARLFSCLRPATATRSAFQIQTGSIRIALIICTSALAVARIIALARPSPGSKSRHRSLRSPKDSSIRGWWLTRLLIAPVRRCADRRVSR